MVYNTDSWTINIKPVFIKEVKVLFSRNIENLKIRKFRNFYLFYLIVYSILFVFYFNFNNNNSNNMKELEIGDKVPEFTLKNQDGKLFNISSVIGKKNLVVYFYPKDDTPGCTAEACSFRDQFEVFREADAEIIGISSQSVESHKKFAEKHRLNFTLLSDEDKSVRKMFGVKGDLFGLIPGRVTFVIDKNGKVVFKFNSQTKAEQHVSEALSVLKSL